MIFYYKECLWFLIIIPIIIILFESGKKDFYKKRELLLKYKSLEKMNLSNSITVKSLASYLIITSIFFMILSLSRPLGKEIETEMQDKNIELVFAVDISNSMKANDVELINSKIKVTRLEGAKTFIREMIKNMKGEKVSIVIFSEMAIPVLPLTNDYEMVETYLNDLSFDYIPSGSTDLNTAIKTSMKRFFRKKTELDKNEEKKDFDKNKKLIFILSDGEEPDKNLALEDTLIKAKKDFFIINTIGIGSEEGSKIPLGKNLDGQNIYKTHNNQDVITKLDSDVLKKISKETNGYYFNFQKDTFENNIQSKISTQMSELNLTEGKISKEKEYQELFPFFIFISILLFALGNFDFRFVKENT
ncbi:MAG: VWA domain-containing protein [Cyanobacteriota bacterium]